MGYSLLLAALVGAFLLDRRAHQKRKARPVRFQEERRQRRQAEEELAAHDADAW